jgi:hypothetical protein
MNDTLPAAFQSIPMEVLYHLAGRAPAAPTPEERAGMALSLCYLVKMRDPRIAKLMAEEAEKQAKKGKA